MKDSPTSGELNGGMNSTQTKRLSASLLPGGAAAFLLLAGSLSLRAAIPEPDLVWYGKVLTASNGATARITAGLLSWRIEPLPGGMAWTNSTRLTNINDQFSFVLRIPCETPEPGAAATDQTVVLTTPAANYSRLTVTLDGQPLSLSGASNQFAPMPADRGRAERIDLVLGTLQLDSDADGLPDAWEEQYFGVQNANPDDDSDGDGVSNLREYRAGTNPQDPLSLFEFVDIQPSPGSVRLRWSSQANFRYRVLRSPTLLAVPGSYQVIQGGIDSTPPVNEFLDATTGGSAQFFYLIEIEE